MTKLTLPIQAGKKYIRRDGEVTAPTAARHDTLVLIDGSTHVFKNSGRANAHPDFNYPHDLIADHFEEAIKPVTVPKGHIHAASMLLYAQDAVETDKPWERWEFSQFTELPGQAVYCKADTTLQWKTNTRYRRKPPAPVFIDINGFQVPEPMRVPPATNSIYWSCNFHEATVHSSSWDAYAIDNIRLLNGTCHFTKEAAQLHVEALLSFTRIK